MSIPCSSFALRNNYDRNHERTREVRQLDKHIDLYSQLSLKQKIFRMPRCKNLFGAHLRNQPKHFAYRYKRGWITKPIPAKAYATRPPSFASQMNLWHNDDFQFLAVCKLNMHKHRTKITPFQYRKDFESKKLNTIITNMRVTPSALYAMDDMGGFDNYIMRTSPEEIRSTAAEKMKNLMYYYEDNPTVKSWGMPWHILLRKKEQSDPWFARYKHTAFKAARPKRDAREHKPFSPYFLPNESLMEPARQEFLPGSEDTDVTRNLWWKASPELERKFRSRLARARSFEEKVPDHREPGGFRRGHGMGGGGRHGEHCWIRKKAGGMGVRRKYRDTRPH
ncbi:unnamed protein product [Amoebophrya sp. A25]|nr:unnamed protein product [Amoebophrya sp. A25]|eukprot:GSA25T00004041001.1